MEAGRFLKRWGAALIAVICGWFSGYLVYISIANASAHDQTVWALWTGAFCLFSWFAIGIPLAAARPDLSSPVRIGAAMLWCGLTGVLMIVLFFRSLAAAVSVFGLLAFLTAAVSMLVFSLLSNSMEHD